MDDRHCLLVIIGATEDGNKELVALEGGFRESELSWNELLFDLKGRFQVNGNTHLFTSTKRINRHCAQR